MAGGRPALFETSDALQQKVNEYFEWIKGEKGYIQGKDDEPDQEYWKRLPESATVTGLALFLGFESRQSLYDYEKNEEFSYIVKKAKLRVEHEYEKKLHGTNVTGPIFALKNMGWADKSEQEVTHKGVTVNFVPAPGCEPIKDE
ncbi:MAG TPA: terminase small subunit [Chitinophagaceae bacterium]|nr:terminase small subunit [Chitinophagaceae bacterium]